MQGHLLTAQECTGAACIPVPAFCLSLLGHAAARTQPPCPLYDMWVHANLSHIGTQWLCPCSCVPQKTKMECHGGDARSICASLCWEKPSLHFLHGVQSKLPLVNGALQKLVPKTEEFAIATHKFKEIKQIITSRNEWATY